MAIDCTLSGTLTNADGSTTLLTKTLAQSWTDKAEMLYQRRLRIANGATETITLPATTGKVLLAEIQTGGPLTMNVGSASDVPLSSFILLAGDFTSLSFENASGQTTDLELMVLAED